MLQRSKSAVGVVVVGLLPALIGGPVFAAAMILFCLVGYREYQRLAANAGADPGPLFALAVPLAAGAALAASEAWALTAIIFGVPMLGLVMLMRRSELTGAFAAFAFGTAGVVYLAIPAYAAVRLRGLEGTIARNWLDRLVDWLPLPWDASPRGLAWLLLVLTTTWLCDTGQYLVGRSLGRTPLSPRLSPKKTVEGFLGGLVIAAAASALGSRLFGLDVNPLLGAALGALIAVIAIAGDLTESLFKRQAGVKDSGDFIPGHGGMLDRIDSLLFTFTAGWLLALLIDGPLT